MTASRAEQPVPKTRSKRDAETNPLPVTGTLPASVIRQTLRALPTWLTEDVRDEQLTVCHFNCGEGKLSEAVQEAVGLPIVAVDASEVAIAEARKQHPKVHFRQQGDSPSHEEAAQYDVVIHIATTETPSDLSTHLQTLAGHATRHLACIFPLASALHGSSSVQSLGKLPLVLSTGLVLSSIHFSNTRPGDKPGLASVLLTYSDPTLPILKALSLSDVAGAWVEAAGSPDEAAARAREIDRSRTEISRLRERLALTEKDIQSARALANHRQTELEHAKHELWALHQSDAQLRDELARMQTSKSWQITRPMRDVAGVTRTYTHQFQGLQSKLRKLSLRELGGRLSMLLDAPAKEESPPTLPAAQRPRFPTLGQALPLFPETVVMFALVPFDDVGGGQRSAQLARVLTARGYRVVYVYLYKKYNFAKGGFEDSHVDVPRLSHLHIDDVTPLTVLQNVAPGSTAIFEAPHPRYEAFFDTCRRVGLNTVFELIDAWDTSLGGDWFKPELMKRFVLESDAAVGTAHALVESLKKYGRKDPLYLPNAGNEQLFDFTATYERPRDLEAGRRALTYVGSLYGEWFGWDYIQAAAEACPDALIYLIGDPPKDKLVATNVRLLGPRPIEQVPAYLAHSDATLLPFIPGKISDAVSPIKIFEYLFMGKPVVATDLPEIRAYPNVHIANSVEHFGRLCADVEGTSVRPERFISANSWAYRADQVLPLKAQPHVSLIVTGEATAESVRRFFETLKLHASQHVTEVVWLSGGLETKLLAEVTGSGPKVVPIPERAATLMQAWDLGKPHCTGTLVGFVDIGQWFTSRGAFEEASLLLRQRATIGAVSTAASWLTRGTLEAQRVEPRSAQAHPTYRQQGYRTDVAYLDKSGLFIRRELLGQLKVEGAAWDGSTFEMAELSFQLRELGFELAWRDLTGLRPPPVKEGSRATPEQAEQFLTRWQHRADLFSGQP